MRLTLMINGQEQKVDVTPDRTLLQVLRDELGLTGTKESCGMGDCGACTVLADGEPVNACLLLAPCAEGMAITTVEGLAAGGELTAVQQAFVDTDAVQCGFCTPGMVVSVSALLDRYPQPDDHTIRHELAGNLCRCTGYHRIFAAVKEAAAVRQGGSTPPDAPTGDGKEVARR